jgi:phosphotransferase system  glucose/maltose/N-acetylglucosamine-specific IIC component
MEAASRIRSRVLTNQWDYWNEQHKSMKRAGLYFAVALVLEGVLLTFSRSVGLTTWLLFPGLIVSALISHGSNTSNVSFIVGLVVAAVLYAYLALLIEKAIKRRRISS